jgi:hypothetical protein
VTVEALCYSLIAGYPVMGAAIAVLWRAHQKSQAALLAEKERRVKELEALKELLEQKARE